MQILVFFLYTHTDLVILFVHERAVTLWYQQGEKFFTLALNQPVFVFGIQVNSDISISSFCVQSEVLFRSRIL